MGFFESSFASAGRKIDDTLESLAQAMSEGGSGREGFFGRIAGAWRGLGEWFERDPSGLRRTGAIGAASALCVGILAYATWRAITPTPPPPVTEAQKAAVAAAQRQVELQNFKARQAAAPAAKPVAPRRPPTPTPSRTPPRTTPITLPGSR